MQIGKLPNEVLKDIVISPIKKLNKDVLVGPEIGEDCSIVEFNDDVCVLTTDPITAAANNAGSIGVHICCNDIASAGVKPLGVMVTILAPPTSTLEDIGRVMKEVNEACAELSIDVLGGHTEITDAVNRMVLSVTAIGKGKRNSFITTGGAAIGDDVVVTGFAGLEGTAILSKDYEDFLCNKLERTTIINAQNLLKNISVVKAGLLAAEYGVSAMHDATEGGILGAIWEVAEASKKGVYILEEKIPVRAETIEICRVLELDYLKLISSGSMIIACKDGEGLCRILRENEIEAQVVGRVIEGEKVIHTSSGDIEIAPPESDEIYKVNIG
jgi:hydrogenase expression/formation protein HypE